LNIRLLRCARVAAATVLACLCLASAAGAQDRLCDPGGESCRSILLDHIKAETVGIDVAFWFMEDARFTAALRERAAAGVPVRVLVDTRANATNKYNAARLGELAGAGIPMRERFTGGILHWKMMLFAGQGVVEFSGANYSADAWAPSAGTPPFTNYTDESIFFTGDASIVNSFRTKYDDLWMDSTAYRDYANVPVTRTRVYGTFPKDPRLNFVPAESYANRAVGRYKVEKQKIDVIMYRITDRRHTDAMIAAKARGVPVRLITEPQQYRDVTRLWHSWNVDRLYMAGIPIKQRVHAGLNHQKAVLLYGQGLTIFGSSNWSGASGDSQEEHNLFTTDATTFQWFADQFERKWNGSSGVVENAPFVPLPPDKAKTPAPVHLATGVNASAPVTLKWYGGPWAHLYDIYLGTDSANLPIVAANLELGPSESTTEVQKYTVMTALLPGTTYYWKIVSRTMANLAQTSATWSFTTAGNAPPQSTATLVREPYLQQVSANGAVVVWATREPGPAELRYGAPGAPRFAVPAQSTLFAATATGMAADYYQHVATLAGLAPSTDYEYDVLVSGLDVNPAVDTFRTAPARGTGNVSFLAFGDSGTGSSSQRQIAALIEHENFDFVLHSGDLAYGAGNGTATATFQTTNDWFFGIYKNWLRARPVFPVNGNHDSRSENSNGLPYLGLFVLPPNGASSTYPDHAERYYSFDYGPVHVVALDTEFAFLDPARQAVQLAWLDADLAATTQPWKVALFHRPPYSAGGEHGSAEDVRAAFTPIFERRGVQLAIGGHEHDYERTSPLRAGSPGAAGVTYVVTGGGGAPLYPAATAAWTAASASRFHYLRGSVAGCTLRLEAVGLDGAVFDSTSITRCTPPVDTEDPVVSITAPSQGASVRAVITVAVSATDNVGVTDTHLLVDGVSIGHDSAAPFGFTWDSTTAGNGTHTLEATATDAAGHTASSGPITVTVGNPTTDASDIVLYTADVPSNQVFGRWQRETDVTAAGGARLRNPNANAAKRTTALAAPVDYFDMTFTAPAGVPYHLWLRGKADADNYANDSVFVQFSDARANQIGTTAAAEVNLEDCSGCRVAGWGWQDNGYGANVFGPDITFTTPGVHTIRIQAREDGLSIDQIVLSPAKFLAQAPGALKNDSNIYARSSGGAPAPTDTESPVAAIVAPAGGATLAGIANVTVQATDNVAVTRVELFVGPASAGTSAVTSTPFGVAWDTRTVTNGSYALTARVSDAAGNVAVTPPITVSVNNAPAADTVPPGATITSPANGATLKGVATVTVAASDDVGVTGVELRVGGSTVATSASTSTPYSISWDTSGLADGPYTLQARALDAAGNAGLSQTVAVTVANAVVGTGDIVLYAADAPAASIVGRWRRESDVTAAGGARLRNPNANAAKRTTALAAPADYFELTFAAPANVPYHLWVRGRADADNYANDSVFVQFSGATANLIGTTSAAEVNLEDCSGCRVAGWGWQDNGYGINVFGPDITFTTSGVHTIRIQAREDGLSIDQIVLSPATFLRQTPGGLKNDTTIYPRAGGAEPAPADTVVPVVSITAPTDGTTLAGATNVTAQATDNVGVARVELFAGNTSIGTASASPYSVSWNTTFVANGTYVLQAHAYDAAGNHAASPTVTVNVVNSGSPQPPDIVLYAADVAADGIVGKWQREPDATAAGGARLRNPNLNAAKRTTALAAPVDYFEMTFTAEAGVPYHLWVRGKADGDTYTNDSVFVQFSGSSANLTGTTAAAEVNLEDCSGCRVAGWGWQDNGYGVNVFGPHVTFTTSGVHTIRIQSREDGLSIDQIVLSPATFLAQSPGALKNDTRILPK
jgi:phosphatidylserine/phosphatidylglycerophosphate/cardiolipin synthase-like enzyme